MRQMKERRLEDLEQLIASRGTATMEELRSVLGVSMNTVRRDVAQLVEQKRAEKVYGGVRAIRQAPALVPYEIRSARPDSAKRAICNRAATLVRDGDIVFIDSGTTTVHLMETLRSRAITVITNNIEIVLLALACPNIRLIMLPGELHRETHSITGSESAAFLSRFNTNIAFMAATGVSEGGVTNSSPLEYEIKRAAVAHTGRAVLMVAGSKFGVTSLLTYAGLSAFDTVVTDRSVPPDWQDRLTARGIHLEIADTPKKR